ncbi:MAG TPA: hypothetical protein VJR23_00480 [Candidatus Acidoferrales bacterium]|nr:hypothetical protein [Candidatus Acidoferrales bacterium]
MTVTSTGTTLATTTSTGAASKAGAMTGMTGDSAGAGTDISTMAIMVAGAMSSMAAGTVTMAATTTVADSTEAVAERKIHLQSLPNGWRSRTNRQPPSFSGTPKRGTVLTHCLTPPMSADKFQSLYWCEGAC